MTENKQFKDVLIEFDKAKRNLYSAKISFKADVTVFMKERGIPIKVSFFGDAFGLDIDYSVQDCDFLRKTPRKIPLDVLTDFCKEFGCEFEYTNCEGRRYIFSFDKLDMLY